MTPDSMPRRKRTKPDHAGSSTRSHSSTLPGDATGAQPNGGASAGPVLVVEDDLETLASIRDVLELDGYSVVTAGHGEEALARLRELPLPKVILLDLMMPIMDGWEFLSRLKQSARLARIPVIVMTAVGSTAGVEAEVILHKPLEAEHLSRTVAHYC